MKQVTVRGFRKPTPSMKLIIDESITPLEKSAMRYRELYEMAIIRKAEKEDYLSDLKQLIKQL